MRLKRALSFIPLSILLLLIFYCAHKVAPSGGPEDKTPPQIVKHFPNADSVGIRQLKYIEIEFSESIRQSTLPGNYWMVPEVGGGLEVKWKGGKKIRFYLQDTLAKNQTYVFTLGTGIKDLHNNAVEAPFQLAFSTGKKLDNGLITGRVYADRKEQDVFIYGYPINQQTDLDSLLFREAKYYTQTDIKGNYQLNYLPYGTYRVIALKDEDYNYVYNKGSDLIGLPFKDVRLDSLESNFSELNLFLIQEDSTGPEIRSIDTVSRREIKVEFNEPIQWSEFNIGVKDSSGQVLSRPKAFSYDRSNQTLLTIYFSDLPEKKPVILALGGAKDLAGNPSKPPVLEKGFTTATQSDTTKPRLLNITPQSNSSAIPYNTRISASFNMPVDSLAFVNSFTLRNEDSLTVPGKFNLENLNHPEFIPDSLLKSYIQYTITVELQQLLDLFGNPFPDTTIVASFRTEDWANLGEISGNVYVPDSTWKMAIVRAKPIRGAQEYSVESPVKKTYRIDYLPAGSYLMDCVIDVNENGIWDKGETSPWHFAEPFTTLPDTVNVRKRWTTQGVDVLFIFRKAK
jgi:hypothetical protein